MSDLKRIISELSEWELDRVTAAEVCIDELLSIFDRHGIKPAVPNYAALVKLSQELDRTLFLPGLRLAERLDRLRRVRDTLDATFPSREETEGPIR